MNRRGRILLFAQAGRAALCRGLRCRQPGSDPGDTRGSQRGLRPRRVPGRAERGRLCPALGVPLPVVLQELVASLPGLFRGAWRDSELLLWSVSKIRYKVTELWGWVGRTQVCNIPCV